MLHSRKRTNPGVCSLVRSYQQDSLRSLLLFRQNFPGPTDGTGEDSSVYAHSKTFDVTANVCGVDGGPRERRGRFCAVWLTVRSAIEILPLRNRHTTFDARTHHMSLAPKISRSTRCTTSSACSTRTTTTPGVLGPSVVPSQSNPKLPTAATTNDHADDDDDDTTMPPPPRVRSTPQILRAGDCRSGE